MINLIFLFIHVYFCFNFITYANRYIIALIIPHYYNPLGLMVISRSKEAGFTRYWSST